MDTSRILFRSFYLIIILEDAQKYIHTNVLAQWAKTHLLWCAGT